MADLQRGKSIVSVTGKVKISDKTFSGEKVSERTGYRYAQLNLGIEVAEGVTIYGEMMGGYAPKKPVVYAMDKDNKSFEIAWADRLNEKIVETVADYKLYKVGLERDEQGKLIVKKFLSPLDVEAYLKEHLKQDMEITVRGAFEFSEYNDDVKRKFKIQNIFLAYQPKEKDENGNETGNLLPVVKQATFIQTVLLTEDSFKKISKDEAKEGEVVVQAQAVEYVGKKGNKEIKKNLPFTLPITVRINKEKPELTQAILEKLFKIKKGVVREMTIEGTILEGYDKQEVSSADIKISPEIQELIDLGLYSEEEAKAKMTVRGNKVSKLIFTRPFFQKDKDDPTKTLPFMDETKYKPEDLNVVIEEEENINIEEDMSLTGGSDESNTDWMKDLGLS